MKKTTIALFIISLINISCNSQNKDLEKQNKPTIMSKSNLPEGPFNHFSEGEMKIDQAKFVTDNINKIKSAILIRGFKEPSQQEFKEKVLEIFKMDVDKYKDILALNNTLAPEIAIKSCKMIYLEDINSGDELNAELMSCINKLIFYNDKAALALLKGKYPKVLEHLVFEYGYSLNDDVLNFVFSNIDWNSNIPVHQLLFGNRDQGAKLTVRKNIIIKVNSLLYAGKYADGFNQAIEGDAYNSITEVIKIMLRNPSNYQDVYHDIAFLLNETLKYGIVGNTDIFYANHQEVRIVFKKNDFYGLDILKLYTTNIYVFPIVKNKALIATIMDKDGFTNLRAEANGQSRIITTIKSSEIVEIIEKNGDWWKIKVNGQEGYVHKSRIVDVH